VVPEGCAEGIAPEIVDHGRGINENLKFQTSVFSRPEEQQPEKGEGLKSI